MKLKDVITAILAMRIVVQFMAQAVGVVLLRKKLGSSGLPFKMWLYPVPVVLSIIIWIFLLYHNEFALYGGLIAIMGVGVFFIKQEISKQDNNRISV
jgi:fructoselysine transporter